MKQKSRRSLTATTFPRKRFAVEKKRSNDETFCRTRFALKNNKQKKTNIKDVLKEELRCGEGDA